MKHILGYSWYGFRPRLKTDAGMLPLSGTISWKLGPRMCIGYFDGKKRVACPLHAYGTDRCQHCLSMDKFFPCLKCDGSKCLNPERRDECSRERYVIYLAVFGHLLKVGISRLERKMIRFVEQGADFVAELRQVTDGMLARRIESAISKRLGITDRVRGETKNGLISCNPNISLDMLSSALRRLNIEHATIHDLREYYGRIEQKPVFVRPEQGMMLSGEIMAVKGNLLILSGEPWKAVNLHSLRGYLFEEIN